MIGGGVRLSFISSSLTVISAWGRVNDQAYTHGWDIGDVCFIIIQSLLPLYFEQILLFMNRLVILNDITMK